MQSGERGTSRHVIQIARQQDTACLPLSHRTRVHDLFGPGQPYLRRR